MTNWIAFDTEFVEDGHTIDLLSIGFVRADGATYYAEPAEADRSRASDWVVANVLPHLTGPVKPIEQIAAEIVEFAGEDPEFWAYYADYDWVALCQLYGTMMDLPTLTSTRATTTRWTTMSEPLDLDAIEQRANAATEGPWEWGTAEDDPLPLDKRIEWIADMLGYESDVGHLWATWITDDSSVLIPAPASVCTVYENTWEPSVDKGEDEL